MQNPAPDPVTARPRRDSYQNLVLISHPRHLNGLGPADSATLIVATEWLAWQAARAAGFDAVHYECALPDWPAESVGPAEDIYLRACDWVFTAEDDDLTLYRGVSLGRLCGTSLTLAWQAATGLYVALNRLCAALGPRRLILRDLSAHFDVLPDEAKRRLAAELAAAHHCELVDQLDAPMAGDAAMMCPATMAPRPKGPAGFKDRLREWAGWAVETIFRLRLAGRRKRPKVFLHVSLLSLGKMIEGFNDDRVLPVISFSSSPKSWAFLGACWRNGILPARLVDSGTAAMRAKAAARVARAIESHWAALPASGMAAVHRETIRHGVLRAEVLVTLMKQVDCFASLFDRLDIDRVVVADAKASVGRCLSELAQSHGKAADESLNGVFASFLKDPTRCGHGARPAAVTRQLAFGQAVADWAKGIGSPMAVDITGYPALAGTVAGPLAPPALRTALVLPGYAWLNDLVASRGRITPVLIDTIHALKALGFEEIRIKLHPGVNNPAYFRKLVADFALPCEIRVDGPFQKHVAWADVVIGPAGSSTFLETVAAGKPYYILRPRPTSIPDLLLPGAIVIDDVPALSAALAARAVPDRDTVLTYWTALGVVADPVAATWGAIARAATLPSRASE